MKKFLVLFLSVFISAVAHAKDKEECTEDAVDMADSLDFSKLHVECSDDPVTLYDPKSKGSFLSKKKTVTAYEKPQAKSDAVVSPSAAAMSVATTSVVGSQEKVDTEVAALDNAGVIFNIREPFTLTGGPQSALNGLFVQMAHYCSSGWAKQKEWVEPAESGYYLHYQFQCAEK